MAKQRVKHSMKGFSADSATMTMPPPGPAWRFLSRHHGQCHGMAAGGWRYYIKGQEHRVAELLFGRAARSSQPNSGNA